jgi:hypothetical protein
VLGPAKLAAGASFLSSERRLTALLALLSLLALPALAQPLGEPKLVAEGFAERVAYRAIYDTIVPQNSAFEIAGLPERPSKAYLVFGFASQWQLRLDAVYVGGERLSFNATSIWIGGEYNPYFAVVWLEVPPSLAAAPTVKVALGVRDPFRYYVEGVLLLGVYGEGPLHYRLYTGPYAVHWGRSTLWLDVGVGGATASLLAGFSGDTRAEVTLLQGTLGIEQTGDYFLVATGTTTERQFALKLRSETFVTALKLCFALVTARTVAVLNVSALGVPSGYARLVKVRVGGVEVGLSGEGRATFYLPEPGTYKVELLVGNATWWTGSASAPGALQLTVPFERCTLRARTASGSPAPFQLLIGGAPALSCGSGECEAYCLPKLTKLVYAGGLPPFLKLVRLDASAVLDYESGRSDYTFPSASVAVVYVDALGRPLARFSGEAPPGEYEALPISPPGGGWIAYVPLRFAARAGERLTLTATPYSKHAADFGLRYQRGLHLAAALIATMSAAIAAAAAPRGLRGQVKAAVAAGCGGGALALASHILVPVHFIDPYPPLPLMVHLGLLLVAASVVALEAAASVPYGKPSRSALAAELLGLGVAAYLLLRFAGLAWAPPGAEFDLPYAGFAATPSRVYALSTLLSLALLLQSLAGGWKVIQLLPSRAAGRLERNRLTAIVLALALLSISPPLAWYLLTALLLWWTAQLPRAVLATRTRRAFSFWCPRCGGNVEPEGGEALWELVEGAGGWARTLAHLVVLHYRRAHVDCGGAPEEMCEEFAAELAARDGLLVRGLRGFEAPLPLGELARLTRRLARAVELGRAEEVREFLEMGANPDAPLRPAKRVVLGGGAQPDGGADERSLLLTAIERGFAEVARLLIESGANVNASDARGNTALHYAASRGDAELVQLLLESGADPLAANEAGETPADLAERLGYAHVAQLIRGWRAAPANSL